MDINLRQVTASDIAEFLGWRYESPYHDYNLDIPVGEALETFLDPAIRCHAILIDSDLSGYCTFGPDGQVPGGDYSKPALDIGAAIRPDLTGRGDGTTYVAAIIEFAIDTFAPSTLRVSIAAPNQRANKVWTANGFAQTARFVAPRKILGTEEFVMLERDLATDEPIGDH